MLDLNQLFKSVFLQLFFAVQVLNVRIPLPIDVPISGNRLAPNINRITTTMIAISGMPRGPTLMSYPLTESGGAALVGRCV